MNETECGPPQEDGEVTYSTNGTIATIHCHYEYLSDDPVIECIDVSARLISLRERYMGKEQVRYILIGSFAVKQTHCGPLEAEHTLVDIENITTFGEVALVSCDTGYLPEGTTPVECLANGTWSEIPSCRVKDCGPPSVAYGQVTTSGNTTFGYNATIVCNEGYSLDGSGEILCTAYGWENVSCVLQDCGNLTIDNGKVLFDTGTKFGDSAEVCSNGYVSFDKLFINPSPPNNNTSSNDSDGNGFGDSCCYYRKSRRFVEGRPVAGGLYHFHPSLNARLILYGDGLDFTRQFLSGEEYDSSTLSISNNNGSARVFFKNTGAVNESTTVFFYEDGKDHDNFHNSSYVPLFLDEVDNVTMALAVEACNGTSSTECIYDFALTLNPAIAADTVNKRQQFDQDQEDIGINCESNYDGCSGNPCSLGRTCTDLSPEEQQSQGRAYMCSECPLGYTAWEDDDNVCMDINECEDETHNCSQVCVNLYGGYRCECRTGFVLNESNWQCSPVCEIPYYGHECNNTCECTGRGAMECNPVRGCVCEVGWTGSTCDDDINECDLDHDICADVRKYCTNTVGSYTCDCINGYEKNDEDACTDFDECAGGTATCAQMCENKPGFYNCYCYFGYKLNDDRRTCTQISDPCRTLYNLTCSGYCVLKDNTAECRCRQGFVLGDDAQTCLDVNECQSSEMNGCNSAATCMNTDGSYQCECPIGSRLENDGRTCTDINECQQETDACTHQCSNKDGGYGWKGEICSEDVDECSETPEVCSMKDNSHCKNVDGSYICSCDAGYNTIDDMCEDVKECLTEELNDCDERAECVETDGNYTCLCPVGMYLQDDGRSCKGCHCASGWTGIKCDIDEDECTTDIDECKEGKWNNCTQTCTNTAGLSRSRDVMICFNTTV
ncbi:MATN2-like protein [Mya arenaria]|uniref:MATN2-like protein n=1 Tax=Mya arenaria TaxID=6604 RepID=A0ABY7FJV1_MYAAR|nr:MATN2-like protein [Mya arenaria]